MTEQLFHFHSPQCGSVVKKLPANAGDASLVPGLGRSPGEGNDNPLQYSCLANPMDRGSRQAPVLRVSRVGHDRVAEHTCAPPVNENFLPEQAHL